MEQSEYLKNLMKRLQQASEPYHDHLEPSHTHSIATIKFEQNEADSSYFHTKRDPQNNTQNNNQTYVYGHKEETAPHGTIMEGLEEAIDNKKTTRNNSALKFNPAKIRKRSEDKFDRELSRRSGSTKGKDDLVEVRDRLVDIVSFLNAKIEGNPEMMDIKKVVDMDFVKESVIPKQKDPRRVSIEAETNKGGLLYLPKFQLHDAKLVKSSEVLNNLSQEQSKVDNEYLNLKHSFDKLNDVNSSHSLHQHHERPKQEQKQHHSPIPSFSNRQNAHITYQPYQQLAQSPKQPLVYINGKLNNNTSRNRIAFPPQIKQIRPLSEVPPVRYIQYPQYKANSPYTSNNISKASIPSTPSFTPSTLPIGQNNRPFMHPPALNLDRPPTFRTITARPLSTQRFSTPVQAIKFVSPPAQTRPNFQQTQKIGLSSRILQQELAQGPKNRPYQAMQSSRLKKKTSPSQHFKQEPQVPDDTPKRILTEGHQETSKEQYARRAEEQLQKISPPKPYTKFSSTTDNPFKASQTIMSSSKKSKFKADISYDILRSIAQQSQQNQPSKNLQASGRSSGRMMSSVLQVTPVTDIPKMNKYLMSGSTKLKRKGIDVSSSKMAYMSQYSRQ